MDATCMHAEDLSQPGRKFLLAIQAEQLVVLDATEFKQSYAISFSNIKFFSSTDGRPVNFDT